MGHYGSFPMTWTPSHKWIVRNGNKDTLTEEDLLHFARCLLEESSPNATTSTGATLVHFAALTVQSNILVKFLKNQGAGIQASDDKGATPLHWAIRNPSKRAVLTLLSLGASPLVVDAENCTPLHYAAECGNVRAAKILLSLFPSALYERNIFGKTPLALACEEEHSKMIRFLLSQGAPYEERVMRKAIGHNSPKVVKALLACTAHENWSLDSKKYLLRLAKKQKKNSIFRTLSRTLSE